MLKHYATKRICGMIFPHSLRHNNIYPLHKPNSWFTYTQKWHSHFV